jgi:transcriptional regulator with XRE-family HTH domain
MSSSISSIATEKQLRGIMTGVNTDFAEWLHQELDRRALNPSELARRARVSQSTVSLVLNEQKGPGPKLCRGIARALDLPPEDVFRRAGLLPPAPEETPSLREALHLFGQLSEDQQEYILVSMRALLGNKTRGPARSE